MRPDSLLEQQALLQFVLGAGGAAARPHVPPSGDAVLGQRWQRGLQVYRANGQALAERALGAAYPVLARLIGDENFAPLARHFWVRHPPLRGDMACWGDALGDFIDASVQLADEPYLGDVARLEWLMHRAGSATDVAADLSSFALLTAGDPGQVTLTLGAGVALLASPYPVVSIVNAHLLGSPSLEQAGQMLAEGCAEHALVWRQGFRPCVRVSTAVENRLLGQLMAGQSLLDALGAVAVPFDFNAWLSEAAQTGLVCGAQPLQTLEGNT